MAAKEARDSGVEYESRHDVMRTVAVFAILAYLFGLFILGITMPLLLDIGFVYDNNDRFVNLTTTIPSIGNDPVA